MGTVPLDKLAMKQRNYQRPESISNLYGKYSSSQDYFYTRHLNELLQEISTPQNLLFDDLKVLDCSQEFLKKVLTTKESMRKIKAIQQKSVIPCIFHKWFNQLHQRWRGKKDGLKWKNGNGESKKIEDAPMFLQQISAYNPQSSKYYLRQGGLKNRYAEGDSTLLSLEKQLSQILTDYDLETPVKEIPNDKCNFKKKAVLPQPIKINDKIILSLHTKPREIVSIPSGRIVKSLSKETREARTASSHVLTKSNSKMRIKIQRSHSNSKHMPQQKLNSAEVTSRLRSYESQQTRTLAKKYPKNFITVNIEPCGLESDKLRRTMGIRIRQV